MLDLADPDLLLDNEWSRVELDSTDDLIERTRSGVVWAELLDHRSPALDLAAPSRTNVARALAIRDERVGRARDSAAGDGWRLRKLGLARYIAMFEPAAPWFAYACYGSVCCTIFISPTALAVVAE